MGVADMLVRMDHIAARPWEVHRPLTVLLIHAAPKSNMTHGHNFSTQQTKA